MKRCSSEMSSTAKSERPEKKMKSTYMGDPRLLPRVQQYLEVHRDKRVVDLAAMADELQSKYGEYGRKKKAAFRKTVEKAYEHFLRSNPQPSAKENQRKRQAEDRDGGVSGEEGPEFSDDNQEYTTYENTNAMNSLMRNFYSKPGSRPGSRPPSQPGSGANTPIGGRSPYRPAESDYTPTPLFTVDRTGNKNLKDSLTPKTKTPISSPKPKAKPTQGVTPHQQDTRSVGLIDLMSDSEDDTPSLDRHPQKDRLTSKSEGSPNKQGESRLHETSDSQSEKITAAEVPEARKGTPTPNAKLKPGESVGSRSTVKKRRRQDPEDKKKGPYISQSKFTFADVGGNDKMLAEVCKLLVHMKHPEVYHKLGVTPPRGLLLHGPPGCGKTLLAHAIAGELEIPFLKVAATEVVSGVSGESEEKVRDIFQKAMTNAPCVLFLDEIDAITQKRENASKDMERRIVSQLLTCMDELNSCETGHVLVIGATNRPDSLDPALRRAGRFDREVSLGIPDQAARQRILAVLCRPLRLVPDLDLAALARLTPGYVGADLMSLAREAAITAVNRVFKALQTTRKVAEEAEGQVPCQPVENNPATTANPNTPTVTPASTPNSLPITDHRDHTGAETDHNTAENCDVDMTEVKPVGTASEEQNIPVPPAASGEQLTHPESCSAPAPEQMEVGGASKQEEAGQGMTQESALIHREVESGKEERAVEEAQAENSAKLENAFLKGLQQSTKKDTGDDRDLATVLGWLKDQPPLTEEQLENLWIEMADFEVAARLVQPSAKREGFATIPDVTWSDIGALHEVRDELQMAILAPVRHPEQFAALGLTSPPGVLLAGPPGCGKTLLAKAVANESGINFISVKGPELLNMYVGESERAVRQVFQRARNSAPCVIFFDELDALCPRRSDGGEGGSSVRVVNQLLTEMDGLEDRKQVFIMAATNRPDIIDPAVLRPGRLDKTLYVGLPGASDRHDILCTLTKNGSKPRLMPDVNLATVAADPRCEGYTGADLAALVREAAVTALRQFMVTPHKDGEVTVVGCHHFDAAFNKIRPSVSDKERLKYEKMNCRIRPT